MNVMNLIDKYVLIAPPTGHSRIPCPSPSSLASLVQDTTILKLDRLITLQRPLSVPAEGGAVCPSL